MEGRTFGNVDCGEVAKGGYSWWSHGLDWEVDRVAEADKEQHEFCFWERLGGN